MKNVNLSLIALAVMGLTACVDDGDDGTNGSNGTSSLIVQTALATGDVNCPNSGVQIESGIDADASGTLESTEINATEYVCTPGVTSVPVKLG